MSTDLTEPERLKLGDLELIIEKGLQTFVEVGTALAQIREQRLYRTSHDTFEAYCQERWGWTRQRAHQLIASSDVVDSLSKNLDTPPPTTESHAAELAKVPEDKRAEVWTEAVESAPKREDGSPKVTAKHVRETATRTIPDLPTNKDGSIDKLGAMRAAREAEASKPTPSTKPADVARKARKEFDQAAIGRLMKYVADLGGAPEIEDDEIAAALDAGAFDSRGVEIGMLDEHRSLIERIIAHARKGGIRVVG